MSIIEKINKIPDKTLLYFSIAGEYWELRKKPQSNSFDLVNPNNPQEYFILDDKGSLFTKGERVVFPSKDNRDWGNYTFYKVGNIVKRCEMLYIIVCITDIEVYTYCFDNNTYVTIPIKEFDWEIVSEKFNPYMIFKPYDKVLVKECGGDSWVPSLISYVSNDNMIFCHHTDYQVDLCIPYNDMTKHLAGKNLECPECYKYW